MGCQQSKQQNVCKQNATAPLPIKEIPTVTPAAVETSSLTSVEVVESLMSVEQPPVKEPLADVNDEDVEDVTAAALPDLAATLTPQIQFIPIEKVMEEVVKEIEQTIVVETATCAEIENEEKAVEQVSKKASRRRGRKAAKQSEEPVVVVADKENSAAAGRKTAANAAVIAAIIGSAPQSSALKQQTAPLANTNSSPLRADEKPKIRFDRETMQKTAPKSAPAASTNLSRKQKSIIQQGHVSSGRRGPVASKWDKGGKSQMQTEKYLEMANAFERLLTNAATINAHLDTR